MLGSGKAPSLIIVCSSQVSMSKLNNSIQGGCAGARQEAGISQQRYLRILVNILDIRYHIVSSR